MLFSLDSDIESRMVVDNDVLNNITSSRIVFTKLDWESDAVIIRDCG